MSSETAGNVSADAVAARAEEIFVDGRARMLSRTSRLFGWLLLGEWIFGIAIALIVSPYAWAGRERAIHEHVYAAIFLGGAIVSLPFLLARLRPEATVTCHVIAAAQMLYSALLIHLTGGRIETHFHVFGSLAFLAFYRDWKVLIPATVVVASDHFVRQFLWPESVYGVANPETWRFLEHASWVAFEDVFLVFGCVTATKEMRTMALRHAEVEALSELEKEKTVALDIALEEALVAKRQAEQASQVKGQFLANMSHEIRTPLNGVIGMTDLLARTPLTPRQAQYVRTVKESGTGLLAVLNDILDIAKIEAGKMELAAAEFSLDEVVRRVCELVLPAAQGKELEFRCRIQGAVPTRMAGDPDRLRQVITNLVSNAVKFTEQGSVQVDVLFVAQTDADVTVRIEVTDTGIGIAPEQEKLLFQPFSQVDSSSARKFGGTGLGLAISKRIVEMFGGEIGVRSSKGAGSTFWFQIPLAKCVAGEALSGDDRSFVMSVSESPSQSIRFDMPVNGTRTSSQQRAALGRVLVADDNAVNQQVAREFLEDLGYAVDLAGNGKEALSMAAGQPYLVVLMDCQMPEMSGYEAATELRKAEGTSRRTPILAVTAYAMNGDRERALEAGMDDYLTKPLEADALAAAIRRWTKPQAASAPSPLKPGVRRSAKVGKIFLEDLPERLARIRQHVNSSDLEALRREVHTLKGSSISIGASELANLCAELERTTIPEVEIKLPLVEGEAESVRRALLDELQLAPPAKALQDGLRR